MRTVRVDLGPRSYSILIGSNLLSRLGTECRRLRLGKRCVIVTDSQVAPLYAKAAADSLSRAGFDGAVISIRAGEASKTVSTVQACYDQLAAHRLERGSFLVALGGGVVGDLAGFVAATFLRGIDFVQVPTSLLAQVDSSVGGKVGVNLKAGKNLAGAFHQPRLVLCDLSTLQSLPPRQLRSGLAEVIKYGVIRDAGLFARLEKEMARLLGTDENALAAIVARCCQIKAGVVAEDEREDGLRAILNFGHTLGHAIENSAGYGHYLHGEAIAIGQVAAAQLSHWQHGLPAEDLRRIVSLLRAAQLPTQLRLTPAKREKVFEAMKRDKKVRGGRVSFVLARRIGQATPSHKVPGRLIQRALDQLRRPQLGPTP